MTHTGGYYLIREPMVRSETHKHTAADPHAASLRHIEALNRVQATPFRVNSWVVDIVQEAIADDDDLSGVLPQLNPEALPPRLDDEVWEAMTRGQKADYKYGISMIHGRNARRESKLDALLRKVWMAHRLRDEPSIYFPHSFDFRFRMYPMSFDLSPQGDDISRGLMMFSDGKRLGATGLYWLAVRLANCAGEDKLPFTERVQWVYDHHDDIVRSAEDPRDHTWWATIAPDDEPLNLLASCREWALAHELSEPEDFVSHLPVAQDGSINGCQHLSLLGRDPVGAFATNCTKHAERQDLYEEVAVAVRSLINEDLKLGLPEAQTWAGQITRSTVKRAVMTTPYGVTERGIATQLVDDGHVPEEADNQKASAKYLQEKISLALENTIQKGKELMAYFQDTAAALARENVPLRWTIPTGSVCTQAYYNLHQRKICTMAGRMVLNLSDADMGISVRKASLASAPNIIHSLDAAMAADCVNRMWDRGITSFNMIHDSYGTHAADVDVMRDLIRHSAYEQYKGDWLGEFHREVLSYAPEGLTLPTPPEPGDFDVSEVLEADFFFS